MQLEHVLARDLVLSELHRSNGRDYVQRRFIISRSIGHIRDPCKYIVHPQWQRTFEIPIELFGLIFKIRFRCPSCPDAGQILPSPRGYVECHMFREKLPPVPSGGQEIHISHHVHGLKRMAHPEAVGGCHMSPSTNSFLESDRGIGTTDWQAQHRRQRRRILCQPPQQANPDSPEQIELPDLGSSGKMPTPYKAGIIDVCKGQKDLHFVGSIGRHNRVNSPLFASKIHKLGRGVRRQPLDLSLRSQESHQHHGHCKPYVGTASEANLALALSFGTGHCPKGEEIEG